MATSVASTATSQAGAATSDPPAEQPAPSPNEMLIVVRVFNWKWGLGNSPQLHHVIEKANAGLVGLTADNEALLYVVTTDRAAACSLAEELEGCPAGDGGKMMRTAISTAAFYLRGKDALHNEAPTGSDGQPLRYSTTHYDTQKYPLLIEWEKQVQASEPEQAARKDPEGSVACETLKLGAQRAAAKRVASQAEKSQAEDGPVLSIEGTAANAIAIDAGCNSASSIHTGAANDEK